MKNIYVKQTKTHGKSIFAKKNFRKGEIVFLICGSITKKPSIFTIPIDFNLFINPLPLSGRELCHSCDPNSGIKNRNQIVAMKSIKKGEEITIDYAMIVPKYGKEMGNKNKICKCGGKNCRGELGSYKTLPKNLKKKYKGFISDYLIN